MSKQGVTIDLSQANLDSLVNAPEAAQIIPTTILRTDNVGFYKGRSVGITSDWLAGLRRDVETWDEQVEQGRKHDHWNWTWPELTPPLKYTTSMTRQVSLQQMCGQ